MKRALTVSLLALPLWWLLGVEQYVWPLLLVGLSVGISLRRQGRRQEKILFGGPLILYSIFLGTYLLSGFAVASSLRWISYSRSFGAFALGLLAIYYLINQMRDWASIRALVKVLATLGVLVSIVGLAGFLGLWRPEISSPFGRLLPQWIAETDYGRLLVVRSIGRQAFLPWVGSYYRPTSLFLYPTLFATALVVLFPLNLFSVRLARRRAWKILAALGALLVLTNLVVSSSRTAWLATLLGIAYYSILHTRRRWLYRRALLVATIAALGLLLVRPALVADFGQSALSTAMSVRRDGSQGRLEVYRYTLEGVQERPLLGWGTERDVEGLPFPAGSHSLYLALLYRHGIFGLLAFGALMVAIWVETRPRTRASRDSDVVEMQNFLAHGRSVQIAAAVSGLTTVMITDNTVTMLWAMTLGLLLATRRLLDEKTVRVGPDWTAPSSIEVLGVRIDAVTVDSLNRSIREIASGNRRALVLNVNVRAMNLSRRLGWFSDLLERAEIVFCDGAGVALAARILGRPVPERITYADWIWSLAESAEASGLKLFFLGGGQGVAERAADRLRARFPELQIAGCHHGFFDKQKDGSENLEIVRRINAADPDILLVAFGMPLQERWLMENWNDLRVGIGLTGGAVFDYVSGNLRRGPRWMTRYGLEWLARILIEPKRLGRRYLLELPPFFLRVLAARLRMTRASFFGPTSPISNDEDLRLHLPRWARASGVGRLLLPWNRVVKRTTDLVLGSLGLMAAIPIIGVCVLLVKLSDPGPAFFRQKREGRHGEWIDVWKLRTMVSDAEARLQAHLANDSEAREEWDRRFKLKKDPRLVPHVGAWMRRYCIDELPQLWSVVRGDMSLVGPRPFPQYHLERLSLEARRLRRQVRPGLSGLWQVMVRTGGGVRELELYDTYYIRNWSLWIDLYLLAITPWTVIRGTSEPVETIVDKGGVSSV